MIRTAPALRGPRWALVSIACVLAACGGGSGGSSSSTATLGDLVWQDLNGNGLQEPGEPGVAGLTVTLAGGSGVAATAVTDASGRFLFQGLAPATYTLHVPTPLGLVPTLEGIGSDPELDSTCSPATLDLSAGASEGGTDFGFAATGSIGDRVWIDENCNGLQDPGEADLDGIRVVLSDGRGFERETKTVDGYYLFTGLSPDIYKVAVDHKPLALLFKPSPCKVGNDPTLDSECNPAFVVLGKEVRDATVDFGFCPLGAAAIGDFVWHDLDLDGLQDPGEPGIAGVVLALEDTTGTTLMLTKTDKQGRYAFKGLLPGDYVVVAKTPACFAPTLCNVGPDDTVDSECSPVAVTVKAGVPDTSVDFGFVPIGKGAIGDFVWHDQDADGLQDPGEPGIDKAKVVLYDGSSGALLGVQWTGPSGLYTFKGLCAGKYKVLVDVTAAGAGFVPSPCNVGSDDTIDNDCSPALVVLPTSETVDLSVDFGFHVPTPHNGCSHGYWKNHSSWPWPYTPGTLFSDVFEDAFPGMTLLAVLKQGGGGLNALGRETVAALLNASSSGVNYPLLDAEVINRFNAVHPGTKQEYNALKDEFEADNTQGCPLN